MKLGLGLTVWSWIKDGYYLFILNLCVFTGTYLCVSTHMHTQMCIHRHISWLMQKKKSSIFYVRWLFWMLPTNALHLLFYFGIQQFFPFIFGFWPTSFTTFLSFLLDLMMALPAWNEAPTHPGCTWSFSSNFSWSWPLRQVSCPHLSLDQLGSTPLGASGQKVWALEGC